MIEGGADLHAHTTASDGELSPAALVAAAVEARLEVVAITDHDSVQGIAEARRSADVEGLVLVPGIEISSCIGGREIHLLGMFVEPTATVLGKLSQRQIDRRRERAEHIVVRARGLGLSISMETVEEVAAGAPIGRPHLARAMLRVGAVSTFQEAFDRYIGMGRPCFVPKALPAAADAIAAVHAAGGVAVVAHPGSSRVRDNLLAELADLGLDGIEVRHPRHGRARERILEAACERLGLLPSGGSDYHGTGPGLAALGQYRVPTSWATNLERKATALRRSSEVKETRE